MRVVGRREVCWGHQPRGHRLQRRVSARPDQFQQLGIAQRNLAVHVLDEGDGALPERSDAEGQLGQVDAEVRRVEQQRGVVQVLIDRVGQFLDLGICKWHGPETSRQGSFQVFLITDSGIAWFHFGGVAGSRAWCNATSRRSASKQGEPEEPSLLFAS